MNYKPYERKSDKELFFSGEFVPYRDPQWLKEKELTDCQNCLFSDDCKNRNSKDRLPADAGGRGQCRRLAEYHTPFSFQNVDGQIIEIPAHVIQAIREGA